MTTFENECVVNLTETGLEMVKLSLFKQASRGVWRKVQFTTVEADCTIVVAAG